MSPRHFLPGGYPNPDPYYISPEEEAAMYDGPPDWDEDAIPEAAIYCAVNNKQERWLMQDSRTEPKAKDTLTLSRKGR